MVDLSKLKTAGTIRVAAPPDRLYDMVSDVTRMGEWSPENTGGTWDDAQEGATVGSWFTGRNKAGDFEWETRCEVVVAERGREFAFVVGGEQDGWVRWGYRFTPVEGGTEVEESWVVLRLSPFMVDRTDEELLNIKAGRHQGIETTLANLERVAGHAGPD